MWLSVLCSSLLRFWALLKQILCSSRGASFQSSQEQGGRGESVSQKQCRHCWRSWQCCGCLPQTKQGTRSEGKSWASEATIPLHSWKNGAFSTRWSLPKHRQQIHYLGFFFHTGISPPVTFSGFSSFLLPSKRVESSPGPSSFPSLSFMSVSSSPLCLKKFKCTPVTLQLLLSLWVKMAPRLFIGDVDVWNGARARRREHGMAHWHSLNLYSTNKSGATLICFFKFRTTGKTVRFIPIPSLPCYIWNTESATSPTLWCLNTIVWHDHNTCQCLKWTRVNFI